MRIFLDTNIITEFLFCRKYINEVSEIIKCIEDGEHIAYISGGSFYTLTYLIDTNYKKLGIANPERLELLKEILVKILNKFNIVELSNNDFYNAVIEKEYIDLEDSYQYRTALKAKCDYLITLNKKDFYSLYDSIKIITPQEFLNQVL